MKYAALILALLLTPAALAAEPVKLAWDYPTNEISAEMVFRLYYSTNAAAPLPWTFLASTNATAGQGQYVLPVQVERREQFFYCTASNFWGESLPSNVASTPWPARTNTNLKISR